MLENVGYVTERRIWEQGINFWKDFIDAHGVYGISSNRKKVYDLELTEAEKNLEDGNSPYFKNKLAKQEQWRLYDYFKDDACFVDIETTGLDRIRDEITVIGMYDGKEVKSYIKGINFNFKDIAKEILKYKMIVTFYGSAFDIPFICQKFPSLELNIPHMDLCFTGRRVGLKGGLKNIETMMGIGRDEEVMGVDGLDAVRLWKMWERYNNKQALEKLVKYNRADVRNLKKLANIIYEMMMNGTTGSSRL